VEKLRGIDVDRYVKPLCKKVALVDELEYFLGDMPGGSDYPLDTSQRFPLAKRNDIKTPVARTEVQGVIHSASGDINNWVTAQSVAEARRGLITALAYLDIADSVQDKTSSGVSRIVIDMGRLEAAVAAQSDLLQRVVDFPRRFRASVGHPQRGGRGG
jgi:hypothetical protein